MTSHQIVQSDEVQIIEIHSKSLPFTTHDSRWVPTSRRFVVVGSKPRSKGALQVYKMNFDSKKPEDRMEMIYDIETEHGIKCANFGSCDSVIRECAIGDFSGFLQVYDLEKSQKPIFSNRVHDEIINCMDGAGAPGPREIVTGSRDGKICLSDIRCKESVVASLKPSGDQRDCWTVSIGGTTSQQDRSVIAGFDNGDVKLWDIRSNSVTWETNLKNGVVALQVLNKVGQLSRLVAGCLSGQIISFDLTDATSDKGYQSYTQKVKDNSTIWTVQHCPQRNNILATTGGNGELIIWEKKDEKKLNLELLSSKQLSSQPISSFDWHPDCEGLAVTTSFDQTVKVLYISNLNK